MSAPYTIDRSRWAEMTLFEQMGNIGSEVGRSFNAKRRNNDAEKLRAIERAIDLFDATLEVLIACRSPRAKEILRAKEVYLLAVLDENGSIESERSLERYFMQFAIAARLNR